MAVGVQWPVWASHPHPSLDLSAQTVGFLPFTNLEFLRYKETVK